MFFNIKLVLWNIHIAPIKQLICFLFLRFSLFSNRFVVFNVFFFVFNFSGLIKQRLRDHLQISLLILNEFKRINLLLFPLESPENININISRSEIWTKSLCEMLHWLCDCNLIWMLAFQFLMWKRHWRINKHFFA